MLPVRMAARCATPDELTAASPSVLAGFWLVMRFSACVLVAPLDGLRLTSLKLPRPPPAVFWNSRTLMPGTWKLLFGPAPELLPEMSRHMFICFAGLEPLPWLMLMPDT